MEPAPLRGGRDKPPRSIQEFGAPILAGLAVMPLIVAAVFSYWVFVRHEILWLDVIIYMASMAGAVLTYHNPDVLIFRNL